MMPDFEPHVFDPRACRDQLQELEDLLESSGDLTETALKKFFAPRAHLRALVGELNSWVLSPDRLAWEYPIFGDFRCDFAIGDWAQKAYTFVECESAQSRSLFVKQGKKATRAWSPHFDAGYSQIIDWFGKLHTMTDTPDMEARFGARSIRYTGVLLVGRDQHLGAGEPLRLAWRREHVVVNSKHIVCLTYDQLVNVLQFRLDKWSNRDLGR
jgi:hypothetical protein